MEEQETPAEVVTRLLLAKYLYLTGRRQIDPAVSMSSGLAVSLFQDAVESLSWTVVKWVDAPVGKNALSFDQFWDVVPKGTKNLGSQELPFRAMMKDLNRVRVAFKHYGMVPATGEAERYSLYAEEFLRETMQRFFSQDFDALSLAGLIRANSVKDAIMTAETFFSLGEFGKSVEFCAVAEHHASAPFERLAAQPEGGLASFGNAIADPRIRSATNQALGYLMDYLGSLRALSLAGVSGRNLHEFSKFRALVPKVAISGKGKIQFTPTKSAPPSEAEAQFCIRYVTDFALQAQERLA